MLHVEDLTMVISRMMGEPYAGLLSGILFGTKQTLPYWLKDDLIQTGTIHIAALSGMNVSIVLTYIGKILSILVGRRFSAMISIGFVIGFVVWVGPSPSIVRAAIMGCLALIATVFGRPYWGVLSWILACGGMLLWSGSLIQDISFQLSALATLGLVVTGTDIYKNDQQSKNAAITGQNQVCTQEFRVPVFHPETASTKKRFFEQIMSVIILELRTTLAAQMFTLPVLVFTFRRISLIAPLANLFIGWTIVPITIIGWIAAVAGAFYLPLGMPFALIVRAFLEYLVIIVRLCAGAWAGIEF